MLDAFRRRSDVRTSNAEAFAFPGHFSEIARATMRARCRHLGSFGGGPGDYSWETPFPSPKSLERRPLPASTPVSPTLRFLFPFIFNRFQLPGIGALPAPMLPSNRRYARTTKIRLPLRPPSPPAHRPARDPFSHRGRPILPQPHLRRRAEDRPVCVTKLPTNPATPSSTGTYPRTRNTLDSPILRHSRQVERSHDGGSWHDFP